ncbi:MAG: hypothetical protein QOJ86_5042 [Bradyrhizobium sp.]|nr:hypothetical protein [Bradyrhizobium sp.]
MRIFKTKYFARYARRERISDVMLREAVGRAERGLVDADLGGGVIKQRIARSGQGRSGGFRVLLAYRATTRSVFLFGFAKSARGNVDEDELATAQEIARVWLEADGKTLAKALAEGVIQEVVNGKEEEK